MSKILDPVALWQDLHQIPELAMQEVKTSAYVAKTLEDLGIPVTRNVGGTGVVGYIRGEEPGPVLMLRADMDALPFTIDGKECAIHACGHDSHTAMLLAVGDRVIGFIFGSSWVRIIYYAVIVLAAFVLYFVYRHSFRLKKSDLISLGLAVVVGAVLAFAMHAYVNWFGYLL